MKTNIFFNLRNFNRIQEKCEEETESKNIQTILPQVEGRFDWKIIPT